jgi:DNA-binding PadR family transcriptional regulator
MEMAMPMNEPIPADSEVLLLSMLKDGPLYGYAISKRAAAASDNQFRLTPGVLYPLLASLEKRGLIAAEWETVRSDRAAAEEEEGAGGTGGTGGTGGRRRKWYSLSTKGEKHLEKRVAAHRAHVALIERFLSPRIGGARGEEAGQ